MYNDRYMFYQKPRTTVASFLGRDVMVEPTELNRVVFNSEMNEEDTVTIHTLHSLLYKHQMEKYSKPEGVILSLDVFKSVVRYYSEIQGGCVIPSEFDGVKITLLPNLNYHSFIMFIEETDIMKQFTSLLFKEQEGEKHV
jgi:hypothetical protein